MKMTRDNPVPKVAAIHDLSGFGRASLTVVIPVLSTMGFQVCPLPTAVLSTHTGGFRDYTYLDLTAEMPEIINHWKNLGIEFDCIYSGFLGSEKQVEIVINFIKDFKKDKQLIVVDPVLGDEGKLYGPINTGLIREMKKLAASAYLITPNFTELAFLLDRKIKNDITVNEIKEWLAEAADEGSELIIATSIPLRGKEKQNTVIAYDRAENKYWKTESTHIPVMYPGTGDIFASVICGALMQGDSIPAAIERAVKFVSLGVQASFGYNFPDREGILLEKVLPVLRQPVTGIVCENM